MVVHRLINCLWFYISPSEDIVLRQAEGDAVGGVPHLLDVVGSVVDLGHHVAPPVVAVVDGLLEHTIGGGGPGGIVS